MCKMLRLNAGGKKWVVAAGNTAATGRFGPFFHSLGSLNLSSFLIWHLPFCLSLIYFLHWHCLPPNVVFLAFILISINNCKLS